MKVAIFLLLYAIAHLVAVLGTILASMGVIESLWVFLTSLAVLILIDIVLGIYFLILKSSPRGGAGYQSGRYQGLKIEEADKYKEGKKAE